MTMKPNRLLDIRADIGQITYSFRFDLCLAGGLIREGQVYPDRQGISIQNDTSANIKRTLRNFRLTPNDADSIDIFRHRICPKMILEDGSEWPLGVFMFPSKEVNKRSVGNFLSSTLFDETFILDQGTSEPFGLNDTTVITDAMWRLIIDSKIGNFNIIDSQTKAKEPIAWPPGTSRLRILAELCEMTSYLSPFIDNDGVLQCVPDNPGRPADHAYTTSGGYARIIADSIVDSSSLLEAPNVYIVVNSGATESEISGRYDIPDLWPHSKLNRGFEVVKTITMQGIESSDKATQIAQTTARHDLGTFKSVSFSSAPDPRHDTFDVVEFDEEFYTEASWSMSLTPGAEMSHDLVGIVS